MFPYGYNPTPRTCLTITEAQQMFWNKGRRKGEEEIRKKRGREDGRGDKKEKPLQRRAFSLHQLPIQLQSKELMALEL